MFDRTIDAVPSIELSEYSSAFCRIAAKTGKKNSENDSEEWLPLWTHLYDTACVMQHLVEYWFPMRAEDIGLNQEELKQAVTALGLLHDIGKATPLFQWKLEGHLSGLKDRLNESGLTLTKKPTQDELKEYGHGILGGVLLVQQDNCPESYATIVASHHGKTPGAEYSDEDTSVYSIVLHPSFYQDPNSKEQWKAVRQEYIKFACQCCHINSLNELPELSKPAQIILLGLLIMADWIASNTNFYPLISVQDESVASLVERERVGLEERLGITGRWMPGLSDSESLMTKRFCFSPNAMQKMVLDAGGETKNPGLFILEAPMGNGKTEAALALAEQIAAKTGKNGVAFFLPSQATGNAIFDRLIDWAKKLENQDILSVELSHAKAEFQDSFAQMDKEAKNNNLTESNECDDDERDDQPGIIVHQFFNGKKLKLLANAVVGTVDQFLMAGLRQRHVMLRHLGLAGKVVIIDECHAYDAYMNIYLDRVLEYLSEYHVPVILLSATLPAARRKELVEAYLKSSRSEFIKSSGKVLNEEERQELTGLHYPMLTYTDGNRISVKTVNLDTAKKEIQVKRITDEKITEVVNKTVASGGCVGIIMNTVNRAQETYELLKNVTGIHPIMYHAQFVMPDRIKKEKQILECVGKKSLPEQRKGVVVVGTQVLEQSLDIDFDVLITDICPMDLLLQRIGRLHRHNRNRPNSLQDAVCYVVGTDTIRIKDEDEQGGTGQKSAAEIIYGHYLLLRTCMKLPDTIVFPDDIITLVQAVYDEEDAQKDIPKGIQESYAKYSEQRDKKSAKAEGYLLKKLVYGRRAPKTIESLLDQSDSITEDSARAAVRDGTSSIEVIIVIKTADGYEMISEKQIPKCNGKTLPSETARELAKYSMRLPFKLSNPGIEERTRKALKASMEGLPDEWLKSPWLHEELFLVMEKENNGCASCTLVIEKRPAIKGNMNTILGDNEYLLKYTQDKGLTVEKDPK